VLRARNVRRRPDPPSEPSPSRLPNPIEAVLECRLI
jgi:hypothetical protein